MEPSCPIAQVGFKSEQEQLDVLNGATNNILIINEKTCTVQAHKLQKDNRDSSGEATTSELNDQEMIDDEQESENEDDDDESTEPEEEEEDQQLLSDEEFVYSEDEQKLATSASAGPSNAMPSVEDELVGDESPIDLSIKNQPSNAATSTSDNKSKQGTGSSSKSSEVISLVSDDEMDQSDSTSLTSISATGSIVKKTGSRPSVRRQLDLTSCSRATSNSDSRIQKVNLASVSKMSSTVYSQSSKEKSETKPKEHEKHVICID